MFYYNAYGLKICSPILLPEFLPTDSGCDVAIHIESCDCLYTRHVPFDFSSKSWDCKISLEEAVLAIKDIGIFVIRRGRQIVIIPAPSVQTSLIRLYLVGTVMAILLYQRNLLVLHASAVNIKGSEVGFMGMSGDGK